MGFHEANSMLPAFAMQLRLCAFSSCCIFSFCCLLLPRESSSEAPEGLTGASCPQGAVVSREVEQDNCRSSAALRHPKWQPKSEKGPIYDQILTNLSADWRNKC